MLSDAIERIEAQQRQREAAQYKSGTPRNQPKRNSRKGRPRGKGTCPPCPHPRAPSAPGGTGSMGSSCGPPRQEPSPVEQPTPAHLVPAQVRGPLPPTRCASSPPSPRCGRPTVSQGSSRPHDPGPGASMPRSVQNSSSKRWSGSVSPSPVTRTSCTRAASGRINPASTSAIGMCLL